MNRKTAAVANDALFGLFRSTLKVAHAQQWDEDVKYPWEITLRMTDEQVKIWDKVMNSDLVEIEDCPNCDNVGFYRAPDSTGELAPEQCQWCHTVKNSRFNNSLPNVKGMAAPVKRSDLIKRLIRRRHLRLVHLLLFQLTKTARLNPRIFRDSSATTRATTRARSGQRKSPLLQSMRPCAEAI